MAINETIVRVRLDASALERFIDAAHKVVVLASAAGLATDEVEAAIRAVLETTSVGENR